MNLILATLAMTHITIMCVTLYLHRSQAHRSVQFHPAVAHFMRFWLWMTTGMNTREWVAVHRKHHQTVDTKDDPHSPKIYGIWRVLFGGVFLYSRAKKNKLMVEELSHGTPNDWVERCVYTAYPLLGVLLMLLIDIMIFGVAGLAVWIVQMIWIPFFAAGVINGAAHWWGYRNYNLEDTSRNLIPWGIVIGGEELHNSHHADSADPKFSRKWWEIDIGWMYIRALELVGLAVPRHRN
jgi:stearoyl-CoA desaturase (delta-9 desaturase)